MKKTVIYARVSTEDQAKEGTSLDTQVEGCRPYVKANVFHVIREFQEQASGASLNRPMLDELLDMVEAGEVDVVLVYKIDRLSRDTGDTLTLLKFFSEHGVELHTAAGPIEDTPEGELLVTLLAAVGKFERRNIAERSRRGKKKHSQSGRVLAGGAPYGYRYIKGHGKFEIDDSEAPHVKKIYHWYVHEGLSMNQIARRLYDEGVPSRGSNSSKSPNPRRVWHAEQVRSILRGEAYTGVWHWGKRKQVVAQNPRKPRPTMKHSSQPDKAEKTSHVLHDPSEWIQVKIPAIISRELWEQAQVRVKQNQERAGRNCKREYLLRGVVKCGECGRKMTGITLTAGSGRVTLVYRCSGRKDTRAVGVPRCNSKNITASKLEEWVWKTLTFLLTDPSAMLRLSDAREEEKMQYERDQATLKGLMEDVAVLDDEEERLVHLYTTGKVREAVYDKMKASLDARRERIEEFRAEIAKRWRDREVRIAPQETVEALCRVAREKLPTLTFDQKRMVITNIGLTVIAGPDRVGMSGVFAGGPNDYFPASADWDDTSTLAETMASAEDAEKIGEWDKIGALFATSVCRVR